MYYNHVVHQCCMISYENREQQQRMFSSTSNEDDKNKNNDKESGGSIPMPDKDEELRLASLQSTITEHYKRGDFTKALKHSQDLLRQTQKHFGQEHPATASAFNNVGLMQKLLGDFIAARQHYVAAMRIYGKVVGTDHASYAMTLHNLGSLNKSQIHFDTSLKATERLSLVETALEYLEEAYAIRLAELGTEHPHTVATKSAIGSTLATQILYEYKMVVSETGDGQQQLKREKKQYIALNPDGISKQQWKAAEDHLREALRVSIENPRGKRINQKSQQQQQNKGKNKKKGKNQKVQESKNSSDNNAIETLSAASAAQNLAVFLKSRAMTESPPNSQSMAEAKDLYEQVESVRSQLLPSDHPDLYATKYSLAELLEAMGEEEQANTLRQAILDNYNPPEPSSDTTNDDDETATEVNKVVVVEKTVASKS